MSRARVVSWERCNSSEALATHRPSPVVGQFRGVERRPLLYQRSGAGRQGAVQDRAIKSDPRFEVQCRDRVPAFVNGGCVSATLIAGSGIVMSDEGTQVLKGVPDKWRLFAVAG